MNIRTNYAPPDLPYSNKSGVIALLEPPFDEFGFRSRGSSFDSGDRYMWRYMTRGEGRGVVGRAR